MRRVQALIALLCLLTLVTGCSRAVDGHPQADPNKAPTTIVRDGTGITIGFDNAPVQLELYTEPQCGHCADLIADFGDQLAYYVAVGQLAVTYRPLTFLDRAPDTHSQRVANAMFTAAESAGGSTVTGPQFQRFVTALYGHRDGTGLTDPEIAELARAAGVPGPQVDALAAGAGTVDAKAVSDANFELLYLLDPENTATPTVYDLKKDVTLDIYDNDWLSKVMES
jgi:protein-disulfide isomerase